MPFASRAQWRACYAAERRGQRWGCREWSRGQSYERLPEKVSKRVSKRKTSKRKTSKRKSVRRVK